MESNGQDAVRNGAIRPAVDWPALLARHDRWLRTAVLARVREAEGVDEVMQAVAVAAIEQRSPLADADKAAAWLYRLAVWQTLLYRRRVGRQRKLVRQFGAGAAGDDSAGRSDPLSWLLSDERRQFVQLALERLSRKDAEILLLKYTEDWSYRELAAHLGISEKAVDARLHRARARLRDELAACNLTGESK